MKLMLYSLSLISHSSALILHPSPLLNRTEFFMSSKRLLTFTLLSLLAAYALAPARVSAQDESANPSAVDSATVAHKLSSRNPVERREAAEELARAAAVEHRRLTEGYRAQEKDTRVRLALDWAL